MFQLYKKTAASVANAASSNQVRFFVDSADGLAKIKNSAGTVTTIGGVASFNGRDGIVVPVQADYDSFFLTPAEGASLFDSLGASAAAYAAAIQRGNHTGTQSADTLTDGSTNKAFLGTERTKLTGIASGATANATDAALRARASHTGTQDADTIVDGTTNKVYTATERTKLAGIASGATVNSPDATLLARANHTGTTTVSTLSDYTTATDARADARIVAAALVPQTRTVGVFGAATGGGALSGNITIGVPPASASVVGSMSTAHFTAVTNDLKTFANVLNFGADPTGATSSEAAIDAAIASLGGAGGTVFFPPGVYQTVSNPYIVSANQVLLLGAGAGCTFLRTTSTTSNQLRLTGYGTGISDLNLQGPGTSTTSNKTAGLGLDIQGTEGYARNMEFNYQYECVSIAGHLVDVHDIICRYFNRTGIIVNHQSDHRITTVLMNNNAATLPTLAGIDVRVTASLILEQLNVINSNFALNISPATGVTIPSVKATDCFFDTSVVGLNMQGAGAVFRSEFTNCWFSTQSTAGIRMDPTVGGQIDGVTFCNCDIYQNLGGTTNGIIAGALVKKWKLIGSSLAGWTNAINLTAGAAHFPTIIGNSIGAISAFAANGTGIVVGAGAYGGLVITANDVVDNTTPLTLGAVTITGSLWNKFRITDNAGINPRGTVTPPIATPITATAYTNNTGFRCAVECRFVTTFTQLAVNGISYGTGPVNLPRSITLDPGSTITITGTGAGSWVWSAM